MCFTRLLTNFLLELLFITFWNRQKTKRFPKIVKSEGYWRFHGVLKGNIDQKCNKFSRYQICTWPSYAFEIYTTCVGQFFLNIELNWKKKKNQICKYCVLFFNHCCVFRQKSLLFLKCRLYKNIREWGIVLSDNSCYTSIDHFQNKNFIDFLSCLPAVELLYFPALFRQSNISNSFDHVTAVI